MTRFRARLHLPGAALLAAGVLASGCAGSTGPRHSTLQQQIGNQSMSATELRMRVYETAERLGGTLEYAADEIRAKSSDRVVRRRAVLWKADGIPALYAAAFRPDPLAGGLDLWLLIVQMELYFTEGPGKNAFGAEQPIAVAAARQMRETCEQSATLAAGSPERYARRRADVEKFARAHPIEGTFSGRSSATGELARFFAEQDAGAFAVVGQAGDAIEDLSLRLGSYSTLMPKEIRWQGELLATEIAGREDLHVTFEDLEAVGSVARRADAVLADMPATMRAASGPLGELLDAQRGALLAAVEQQRIALSAYASSERQAISDTIAQERRAAFEALSLERAAALKEVDAISKRSLDAATERAHGVVDYVFWRVLVLFALGALIALAAHRIARGPRPSTG